jgi:hypothetical protein
MLELLIVNAGAYQLYEMAKMYTKVVHVPTPTRSMAANLCLSSMASSFSRAFKCEQSKQSAWVVDAQQVEIACFARLQLRVVPEIPLKIEEIHE